MDRQRLSLLMLILPYRLRVVIMVVLSDWVLVRICLVIDRRRLRLRLRLLQATSMQTSHYSGPIEEP
jgi:hypothetical protein